ncbi:MAG TPA: pullulanase-type alpha-1,6-glucosidase [Burkholderiaceae bacterium]
MQLHNRWRRFLGGLLVLIAAAFSLAACGGNGDTLTNSDSAGSTAKRESIKSAAPVVPAANMRMHFHRAANVYSDWGVYSWSGPLVPDVTWIVDRFLFAHTDSFGGYVDIPLDLTQSQIHFLVTDASGNKNCQNDQSTPFASSIATTGQEIWMLENDCTIYSSQPAVSYGNLANANALWLSANAIAWPGVPASGRYQLYYAANGGMGSNSGGVTGADGSVPLSVNNAGLPTALQTKFPYAANATALTLAPTDAATVGSRLGGQFVIAQFDDGGSLLQVTSLQLAGMLDDRFAANAANAKLGLSFSRHNAPTFAVWAPTARSVSLNVYPSANATTAVQYPMTKDAASGVWSYTAKDVNWANRAYYTYTVNVFSRWANNAIVSNEVTDPYSLSLNANGQRSFIVNLDSEFAKPDDWNEQRIPQQSSPTDIALYELHIRDFSASDQTVPAAHRGKYLAFTDNRSNGMQHLRSLSRAGLTHVHLLPSFDFSSINETGCVTPVIPSAAPDSTTQQAAVAATQNTDCFNWGYDPAHYTAPEGSYATDANDGIVRVREFRSMVKSLHEIGLNVTMDVVYNHTSQAEQGPMSVLDKIVPTYYYRLRMDGSIANDSCCSDTAAENAMMAKLMVDSVTTWATQYKVDSFRFDIMGLEPLSVIKQIQTAVNQATGRHIYLYGEGWNFGMVANDARFVQARQANLYGTGIGSFNDRLRDAVRGGGCCDSGGSLVSQQGFINGAYFDPTATSTQTVNDLLNLGDLVRVGLSGTLRDYSFVDRTGTLKTNAQIDYFGQPAGYTANPGETINYIEAHDNQTLFDLNTYKMPANSTLADRVRVQNLGAAINTLSQGVPFFHAGQDMLRSKSLDQNSYDSGDWFNVLDFSYQSNNFGVGLPPAGSNQGNWYLMSPILTNPLIKPDNAAILNARDYFAEMLAIRKDTSLFRLRTGQDVKDRLSFYNVGPSQIPGLIAMRIDGSSPSRYEGAKYKSVVVLFNVDKVGKTLTVDALKGRNLALHPLQSRSSVDALARTATYAGSTGTFTVPARTTVVFVEY